MDRTTKQSIFLPTRNSLLNKHDAIYSIFLLSIHFAYTYSYRNISKIYRVQTINTLHNWIFIRVLHTKATGNNALRQLKKKWWKPEQSKRVFRVHFHLKMHNNFEIASEADANPFVASSALNIYYIVGMCALKPVLNWLVINSWSTLITSRRFHGLSSSRHSPSIYSPEWRPSSWRLTCAVRLGWGDF